MEEAVTFQNKDGKRFVGIIHIPDQPLPGGQKVGINILNPGIKYRVAPNRLNVKLARELCRRGFYVLRFDPGGVGDSEGELPDGLLVADIWEKIQTGLFTEDTVIANDFFMKTHEIDKLCLIGSCGGAITALLTSTLDKNIDALCLIDIPVNLRSSVMTFADKLAEGSKKADWYFSEYMKKLFNINAWIRFISFKSDYRALWKIINMKINKSSILLSPGAHLPEDLERLCQEKKLNRLFFEAFESFIEDNKPVLFILAGNDPGTEIFQQYFQKGYLKGRLQNTKYKRLNDIFMIDNANHVYTLNEWQESLISKILNWIDTQNSFEDVKVS